jgi:predicted metal-binding membrane protein
MAATPQAAQGTVPLRLRRIGWRHPEWWVALVAAAAWTFMVDASLRHATHAHAVSSASHGIIATAVMVAAMMLPLVLANVRHVALSSLWRRRHRAMAAFLVGYLCCWAVAQTVIQGTLGFLTPLLGWTSVAGLATVTAVLWGVSPGRKRRLRRCGLTVPLAPRGWRADTDCTRYGVITGLSCVTTCWALMAAVAAFSHSVLVMGVVLGVQVSDRYQRRPSPDLAALAVLGVCLLSLAAGGPHH